MTDAIGGYFGLELNNGTKPWHKDGVFLNSGRACFEYILRVEKPRHVYLPKYTCDVMIEPLDKLNVKYSFYRINEALEISEQIEPSSDELLVYNNYFGVKDKYCEDLVSRFGDRLIIDCSQAFYFLPQSKAHTFYSPRKFFGLPDGGILFTNKELKQKLPIATSHQRSQHLLIRIDQDAEKGYKDFKINEDSLRKQPIQVISLLTKKLYESIDFDNARQVRNTNFAFLHDRLASTNLLKTNLTKVDGPMCYPYIVEDDKLRQKLIDNKIYVPTFWPNVFDWCQPDEFEYNLANKLLPLPIDQRYGTADMKRILDVINE